MDAFTDSDRERAIDTLGHAKLSSSTLDELRRTMGARLEILERGQRRILRRQRAVAPAVTKEIVAALSKRAALLIVLGMVVGSALGSATIELVRKLIVPLISGQ